jgi:hypothetical protein
MRILFPLLLLLLVGCVSTPKSRTECTTTQCDQSSSSTHTLMIWWGKSMRDGLKKGQQTTAYVLPY